MRWVIWLPAILGTVFTAVVLWYCWELLKAWGT